MNLATDQFEVVVVVAAGNNAGEACSKSLGKASSSVNVGSHDLDSGISWFSNTGSCVDVTSFCVGGAHSGPAGGGGAGVTLE